MVYKVFDKKSAGTRENKSAGAFTHTGTGFDSENHQLAD